MYSRADNFIVHNKHLFMSSQLLIKTIVDHLLSINQIIMLAISIDSKGFTAHGSLCCEEHDLNQMLRNQMAVFLSLTS